MLVKKIKIKLSELSPSKHVLTSSDTRYIKNPERFEELKDSLECGYHPEQYTCGYIKIDKNNRIWDGNHRLHALKQLHKGDYEIDVKQVSFIYRWAVFPILFVMWAPFGLLNGLQFGFRGKEYTLWKLLILPIVGPIKLLMYVDKWSRSKITIVKKIISFNKNNPYKHHEK